MIKLEELLNEYCPDGVEYKAFLDVVNVLYGYPCDASQFNDYGYGQPLVRIRDVLIGRSSTYTTEEISDEYVIHRGDLLVGMDGNFHVANYKDEKGILCQRVCKISSKNSEIICDGFLSHYLPPVIRKIEDGKQSGTVKHLLAKDFTKLQVPVPPLVVQREIVRILDNFSLYLDELTDELTARRKQYEFYRDSLLTFDKNVQQGGANNSVQWKKLGEVAEIIAGGDVPKESFSKEKTDEFSVPIYSNGIGDNALYGYTNRAKIFERSVTISARGTIGYAELHKDPYFPIVRLVCVIPKKELLADFLKYYLETIRFDVPMSGIPQLTVPIVRKKIIPIPPLAEQERIVAILDKFDALCNDITAGLPAEIEMRKKQYEYYRDKLLTFKKRA